MLLLIKVWKVTNIARRNEAWDKLRSLNSRPERPWLCCGDFNDIIIQDERLGGATRSHNQMQQFRDVIDECGFMDLGFEGPKYTWSRHFEIGNSIQERLNRCLATNSWFLKFPGSKVYHLRCNSSNHNPLHIVFSGLDPHIRKKYINLRRFGYQTRGVKKWFKQHGLVLVILGLRELFWLKQISVGKI